MIGFVCGTGYEDIFDFEDKYYTPYGKVYYSKVENVLAINRHMGNLPPHRIPYKAIVYFFKKMGVKFVVGASAVGSLRKEIEVGSIIIPDQLIDFCGIHTFYDNARIHVSMSEPFSEMLREKIRICLKNMGEKFVYGGTYICNKGPQFETLAEVYFLRNFGHVVGMTVGGEAKLFREVGIEYQPICIVTNHAGEIENHELNKKVASEKSKIIKSILFCAELQNL